MSRFLLVEGKPKTRENCFPSGEYSELNIVYVKCTVADDNGWVTDFVFIQREMGEK